MTIELSDEVASEFRIRVERFTSSRVIKEPSLAQAYLAFFKEFIAAEELNGHKFLSRQREVTPKMFSEYIEPLRLEQGQVDFMDLLATMGSDDDLIEALTGTTADGHAATTENTRSPAPGGASRASVPPSLTQPAEQETAHQEPPAAFSRPIKLTSDSESLLARLDDYEDSEEDSEDIDDDYEDSEDSEDIDDDSEDIDDDYEDIDDDYEEPEESEDIDDDSDDIDDDYEESEDVDDDYEDSEEDSEDVDDDYEDSEEDSEDIDDDYEESEDVDDDYEDSEDSDDDYEESEYVDDDYEEPEEGSEDIDDDYEEPVKPVPDLSSLLSKGRPIVRHVDPPVKSAPSAPVKQVKSVPPAKPSSPAPAKANPAPPVRRRVSPTPVTASAYEVPTDLRDFLKSYPGATLEEAKRYFPVSKIKNQISLGRITLTRGRLYL